MAVTSEPAPRLTARIWTTLAGLGPKRGVHALVLLVLAATALFGGLDQVDPSVTDVDPGEAYDDGALTVTVKRASLVPAVMAGKRVLIHPKAGFQYLAVVAAVANDGTQPVGLDDELDLHGVADATRIAVFRLADGTQTASLGPGLADDMGFVWQVPVTALHSGDTVTVRIWKKQYTELSVAQGRAWLDSLTDYGQVEIPLGVRP
jgi:hypothetical protein